MKCPFKYFKKTTTIEEAQSNIDYWDWIKLTICPDTELKASWDNYVESMEYAARQDMAKFKVKA